MRLFGPTFVFFWQKIFPGGKFFSGMWPNCLEAVTKAGIRCPHQLVVGGGGIVTKEEQQEEEQYFQHSMY